MNIILFGPPGAGKGTQAENLVKEFNFFKASTGDLLRQEIVKKSSLGIRIKSIIEQGLLVSDDITNDLIKNILSNNNYFNRIIFDGYPRNLNQSKHLDVLVKKYNQKILCVFSFQVDQDIVIKRIIGRQVCSKCGLTFNEFFNLATKKNHQCGPKFLQKRSDDNYKTAKSRFETYTKETLPVLNYYKSQKLLYEINGMTDISSIYKEIRRIIYSLEA